MNEQSCPKCGAALRLDAAEELCTKCLLEAGLEGAAGDGHLHVRCPHCHNPIELVEETPLRDITCPSCDSKFCLKCLEKEPGRRYATAAEVRDELQRFMKHEPILARPITSWERSMRWSRRNPVLAALGTALVLLLVTIGVASPIVAWFTFRRIIGSPSPLRTSTKLPFCCDDGT